MHLLYLDEFGHNGVFDPALPNHQHSPIFGLGGVFVQDAAWRELDRGYLRLKLAFFRNEIANSGERPERWEFKGTTISTPSKQKNRRNHRFALAVLGLLKRLDCLVIAKGKVKRHGLSHDPVAVYTSTMQGVMRSMETCLRNLPGGKQGVGLMVADQRTESKNLTVIASAQSHLFSNTDAGLPAFTQIIESPLVVDSKYYHGVQVADIVCGILGGLFRWRRAQTYSANYQAIENRYGTYIDRLTHTRGHWKSVWVD